MGNVPFRFGLLPTIGRSDRRETIQAGHGSHHPRRCRLARPSRAVECTPARAKISRRIWATSQGEGTPPHRLRSISDARSRTNRNNPLEAPFIFADPALKRARIWAEQRQTHRADCVGNVPSNATCQALQIPVMRRSRGPSVVRFRNHFAKVFVTALFIHLADDNSTVDVVRRKETLSARRTPASDQDLRATNVPVHSLQEVIQERRSRTLVTPTEVPCAGYLPPNGAANLNSVRCHITGDLL